MALEKVDEGPFFESETQMESRKNIIMKAYWGEGLQ